MCNFSNNTVRNLGNSLKMIDHSPYSEGAWDNSLLLLLEDSLLPRTSQVAARSKSVVRTPSHCHSCDDSVVRADAVPANLCMLACISRAAICNGEFATRTAVDIHRIHSKSFGTPCANPGSIKSLSSFANINQVWRRETGGHWAAYYSRSI